MRSRREGQRLTFGVRRFSAGGQQNAGGSGVIPQLYFQLKIHADPAGGNHAQVPRGASAAADVNAAGEIFIAKVKGFSGKLLVVGRGSHEDQTVLHRLCRGLNGLAVFPGAFAEDAGEELIGERIIDHTDPGLAVLQQADAGDAREKAFHEIRGPVDGINDKGETGFVFRKKYGSAFLFSDKMCIRHQLLQPGDQEFLHSCIIFCHKIRMSLLRAPAFGMTGTLQNDLSRIPCGCGNLLQQLIRIFHHLIPPATMVPLLYIRRLAFVQ